MRRRNKIKPKDNSWSWVIKRRVAVRLNSNREWNGIGQVKLLRWEGIFNLIT